MKEAYKNLIVWALASYQILADWMSKKSENSSTQTGEPLYQQFAEGKHIIPARGRPEGVTEGVLKGTRWGNSLP